MKTFWNRRFEDLKSKHFLYKGEKHYFIDYEDNEDARTVTIRTNSEIFPPLAYRDFEEFFRDIQIVIEKQHEETGVTATSSSDDNALLLPPELQSLIQPHNNFAIKMAEKLDKMGDELLKPSSNDNTRLRAEAMAKLSNASYNQHKQLWQMVRDLNNMKRQAKKNNSNANKKDNDEHSED